MGQGGISILCLLDVWPSLHKLFAALKNCEYWKGQEVHPEDPWRKVFVLHVFLMPVHWNTYCFNYNVYKHIYIYILLYIYIYTHLEPK